MSCRRAARLQRRLPRHLQREDAKEGWSRMLAGSRRRWGESLQCHPAERWSVADRVRTQREGRGPGSKYRLCHCRTHCRFSCPKKNKFLHLGPLPRAHLRSRSPGMTTGLLADEHAHFAGGGVRIGRGRDRQPDAGTHLGDGTHHFLGMALGGRLRECTAATVPRVGDTATTENAAVGRDCSAGSAPRRGSAGNRHSAVEADPTNGVPP